MNDNNEKVQVQHCQEQELVVHYQHLAIAPTYLDPEQAKVRHRVAKCADLPIKHSDN